MPHKIFLSHNRHDKPVVEPIAIMLAEIFGQDQVFYDDWSIQPGDGIIARMSEGLEAPEFVFFFVSATSLRSGMVSLEWQNALHKATQGQTKIIPVRVDGSAMPPVLTQTLYIDMHTIGLEAAIAQIVSVAQGSASFTPQHQGFSNLTFAASKGEDGAIDIVVRASHLIEPKVSFLILVRNPQTEVKGGIRGTGMISYGFATGVNLQHVGVCNGIKISAPGATLTPTHPFRMKIEKTGAPEIDFVGVLHEAGEGRWTPVPASK